jgi:hypothetical protein
MRAVAIAIAALVLLPAGAAAKTGTFMNSTPDGLTAGEPWDVQFGSIRNDAPVEPPAGSTPAVVITSERDGRSARFPAHHLHNGMWITQVVFPHAGRWTYRVTGFGPRAGHQFWDPATILPAPRASKPREVRAGVGGGDGFPYGWAGGAAAALLLAAGLAVRRLRT